MSDHARTIRGRDAIAAVLESVGLPADEARSRAGNIATALGHALPNDDVIQAVRDSLAFPVRTYAQIRALRDVTTDVLAAWIVSERAPGEGR